MVGPGTFVQRVNSVDLSQERELVECIIKVGQASKRMQFLPAEEAAHLQRGIDQFDRAMRQFYGEELMDFCTHQPRYEEIFREIVEALKTGREWKGIMKLEWCIQLHLSRNLQVTAQQITKEQVGLLVEYYVLRLLVTMKDRIHLCGNVDCQTLFLGRPNQRFCTPTCRNKTNVKKYRYKMKYQRNYS